MNAHEQRRYRWHVFSRVLAAALGGYVLTSLITVALAQLLSRTFGVLPAAAVLSATLLSFAVYTVIVCWIFSTRSATRAWLGVALPSLALGALLLICR
ncbi:MULTISPECIES: DUF3649 domain-containing protein [unclassified Duganella]|uniref:DUF3649 domain-containing protein n=1 Tax=unclassified Duganella TaxID=2636909 RepID=UPI00088060EB|nr:MULTISPECIES: DUF3649 domain-containing protein [unclassified Duganella]SDG35200.1 Protein of unknown function [Duganella sp. OV458]SDJ68079.1 Protein of unknown function [Duganella sp. OV510]